jgi:hypothetical protein
LWVPLLRSSDIKVRISRPKRSRALVAGSISQPTAHQSHGPAPCVRQQACVSAFNVVREVLGLRLVQRKGPMPQRVYVEPIKRRAHNFAQLRTPVQIQLPMHAVRSVSEVSQSHRRLR